MAWKIQYFFLVFFKILSFTILRGESPLDWLLRWFTSPELCQVVQECIRVWFRDQGRFEEHIQTEVVEVGRTLRR